MSSSPLFHGGGGDGVCVKATGPFEHCIPLLTSLWRNGILQLAPKQQKGVVRAAVRRWRADKAGSDYPCHPSPGLRHRDHGRPHPALVPITDHSGADGEGRISR